MKTTNYVLGLLIILCMSGCGSYNNLTIVPTTQENGANYSVGKVLNAKVGAAMISINRSILLPAYKADFFFQPPKLEGSQLPPVTIHQEWVARYQEGDFYVINSQEFNPLLGVTISKEGVVQPSPSVNLLAVFLRSDLSPPKFWQSDWQLPNRKLFSRAGYAPAKGTFRCELVYAGKISDYIELQYNEYNDSDKQPSFTQRLKYNVVTNKRIEFRSFKLRVEEATENNISFEVVDDGGLPWVPKR